jgi:hypothetical protein
VLELSKLDLAEIVLARDDREYYEHRWLIDPLTGEIVFWTSDSGIDGQNRIDLDELDHLVSIEPEPSYVRYRDMAVFAEGISDRRAGSGWGGLLRGRARSGGSRMCCISSIRNWFRPGMRSATAAGSAGPLIGSLSAG